MPDYVPIEGLTAANMSTVTGPAFFTSVGDSDSTYIVTGGDDPQAIIISGEHMGRSYRAKTATGRVGFFFKDIRFEVDPSSAILADRTYPIPCSLRIAAGGPFLCATSRMAGYGFDDPYSWAIDTGKVPDSLEGAIAFTRWRVCRQDRDETIELAAIDVTQSG
jgi:hypothetical protein